MKDNSSRHTGLQKRQTQQLRYQICLTRHGQIPLAAAHDPHLEYLHLHLLICLAALGNSAHELGRVLEFTGMSADSGIPALLLLDSRGYVVCLQGNQVEKRPTHIPAAAALDPAIHEGALRVLIVLAARADYPHGMTSELIAKGSLLPHETVRAALTQLEAAGYVWAVVHKPEGITSYRLISCSDSEFPSACNSSREEGGHE